MAEKSAVIRQQNRKDKTSLQDSMISYYKSQIRIIKNNYGLAVKQSAPDGFHDMRVSIKRIRALFKLAESINTNFNAGKRSLVFRRLFKSAGKVRDIQVQQDLVKSFEKRLSKEFSSYDKYLRQREIRALKAFWRFSDGFNISTIDNNKRELSKTLKEVPDVDAEFRAKRRLDVLKFNLLSYFNNPALSEELLHEIRIILKEARYTLGIFLGNKADSNNSRELDEKLRAAHQSLGKWHDDDVGMASIKKYIAFSDQDTSFDRNLYDDLFKKMKEEKEYYLEQFYQRWSPLRELLTKNNLSN